MVRIRLTRVGLKRQASFRIIITEGRKPRDTRYLESIGFYNPRTQPETVKVDEERALYWLGVGAQPSDAVQRIFTTIGTMDRFGRLKAGEAVETLVAEADAAADAAGEVSARTRYPAPAKAKVIEDAVTEAVEAASNEVEEAEEETAEATEETAEADE